MKALLRTTCLFFVSALLGFSSVRSQQINHLQTPELNLTYEKQIRTETAVGFARNFSAANRFNRAFWGYTRPGRANVFLSEMFDPSAGPSMPVSLTGAYVSRYPFGARLLRLANYSQIKSLIAEKPAGGDNMYRTLFGMPVPDAVSPLTYFYAFGAAPRTFAPVWFLEGTSRFMDTWAAGGTGPAADPYAEMVFRSLYAETARFPHLTDLEPGEELYLLSGIRFINYLTVTYGPQSVFDWVSRTEGSSRLYTSQFKKIFKKPLSAAWQEWTEMEGKFQKKNLERIEQAPVTQYSPLVNTLFTTLSGSFYNTETFCLYFGGARENGIPQILEYNITNRKIRRICDIPAGISGNAFSLAYDDKNGTIYFLAGRNGTASLYRAGTGSKTAKLIYADLDASDIAFNRADQTLWAVKIINGASALIRLNPPYTAWTAAYTFDDETACSRLDISPDGTAIAAILTDAGGKESLAVMELNASQTPSAPSILYAFENACPGAFRFSSDGSKLTGTAYVTGVSNIISIPVQTKKMEILTNTKTGYFYPAQNADGGMFAFRYSPKGYRLCATAAKPMPAVMPVETPAELIARQFPVVKTWNADEVASVMPDSSIKRNGPYNLIRNVSLQSAYPVIEGYKDHTAVGYRFKFTDLTGLAGLNLGLLYSTNLNVPEKERFHAVLDAGFLDWNLSASYNKTDFYDLVGPVKRSRKGYSLGLQYEKQFISSDRQEAVVGFKGAMFGDIDRLPEYQNVPSPEKDLFKAEAKLGFSNILTTPGPHSLEKGYRLFIRSKSTFAGSDYYPRTYAELDYGVILPAVHTALWLRSSGGFAYGDRENVFANFFFGGFGNNYIDCRNERRYRGQESFPGLELNEIGGKNYFKTMLELTMPEIRFTHAGLADLYASGMRISFFSAGLITNLDDSAYKRELINFGVQADIRIVLLSNIKTVLSAGYAAAAEDGVRPKDEFMVSLRVF